MRRRCFVLRSLARSFVELRHFGRRWRRRRRRLASSSSTPPIKDKEGEIASLGGQVPDWPFGARASK